MHGCLFFVTPYAVSARSRVKALHAVVAVPAKIPFVQLFLPYPITGRIAGKALEVARTASDAPGLQMVIMAEMDGIHVRGLENDVAAAVRQRNTAEQNSQYADGRKNDDSVIGTNHW
jgi:hypothetical protein